MLRRSAVLAFLLVACNAILDNEEGTLATAEEAGTEPPSSSDGGQSIAEDSGGSSRDASPIDASQSTEDSSAPDAGNCGTGQTRCGAGCVLATDPKYGCGSATCSPCALPHARPACGAGKCAIAACDPGFADCNADPADGCETDLSLASSCGACRAACPAATPICTPVGATFQCANNCTPAAPVLCGTECVNPLTSENHCGTCGFKCPTVANAVATCSAGRCGVACNPGFQLCGNRCVTPNDPTACGAACTVCPAVANGVATCTAGACGFTCNAPNHACGGQCVPDDVAACGATCTACLTPPNAVPTCTGGACGFTCVAGHLDCNADAADGCETAGVACPDAGL